MATERISRRCDMLQDPIPEHYMTTIKVLQNGPLQVDGADVSLADWNNAAYPLPKRPFYLCRCGASTTKPFCDGTHSKIGFKAAEASVPGSADRPAK
jgi:3-phenylpropionate/trans-cinnamate dioxygenase ferredoxin subunit